MRELQGPAPSKWKAARRRIGGVPTIVDSPILAKRKIAADLGTALRFHWLTCGRTTPQWIDYPPPVDIKF